MNDEKPKKPPLWLQFPFWIISRKSKIVFYTSLSQLLDSGVPILRSLELLCKQQRSFILKAVTRQITQSIKDGESFAGAMAMFPRIFSSLEIRMVEFGEKSANLSQTLDYLADTYSSQLGAKQQLILGLIYPFMLIVAAITIVPLLQSFFLGDPMAVLKGFALSLGKILGVIIAIWISWRILRQIEWLRYIFHYIIICIPFVRGIIYRFNRARFANVLKAMYQAGISIVESMHFAAANCGNYVIERKIRKRIPGLKEGKPVSEILAESRVFKPMSIGMIASAEESGSLDTMLHKFAEWEQREAAQGVQLLIRVVPFLIYIAVMLYIVYLIITLYQERFDMINDLF